MDTDTKIPSEFRVERRGWIWVESSSEATQTNQQKEEEPPENETIFPPYPDPVPPNFNMQYQASSTMMPMCSTSSNDEIDQLLAFQPSELSAFYFASQQQQPVNYPNNINAEDVLQQLMFHTAESVSTSMLSTRRPSIASEPGFILENTMFSSPEMCKFDTFMPSGPSQFEMNLFGFGASPTQTHQLLPPPKPPTSSLSLDMTGFSIPNTSNFQSFFTTATIMNQPSHLIQHRLQHQQP
ncbi:hypothetical protein BCR33DRAFT_788902 [Rhizoclosmatium globosum]|uniref:Uncharacterized protein n=1 Tax=Rhizoclosmatium globosum TaxID=329046 RepID=A0A1Y2BX65_9FUNG|nr:hypothetical protein BCR33DRAFT_788902 [Rhizoclosmatium globosum]|eukprot:ORY38695.1 hypothetical protein BCR33DRAFT_788902 [Rhizoclosmatium globosum]